MVNNSMKEFEEKLASASLKQFLVSTPYSSGNKSFLDRSINDEIFYSNLYCKSEMAESICKQIMERSNNGNTKNIILPGYKGCGKTTFVHYFMRTVPDRTLLLNFDDYVNRGDGKEIKTIVLLDVFRKLTDDVFDEKGIICKKMYHMYALNHNKSFFSRYIDSDNSFKEFFEIIKKADNLQFDAMDDFADEKLKPTLNKMQVHQLLIILIWYDLANRIIKGLKSKCYVIFDNLDVIDNTVELEQFTKDISAFRNNIGYILDNISYEGLTKVGYNAFQDYTIIFCMRETTKAEFIEHFNDRGEEFYIVDNVSSIYDKEKIVQARYNYLSKSNRKDLEHLKQDVWVIKSLLEDSYVKEVLIKLFNYDYRTSVNVLTELEGGSKHILQKCIDLKKDYRDMEWSSFGSRCILFRKIFDLFKNNYYFEKIKESEYSLKYDDSIMAINITRLILLYLKNSQTLYLDAETVETQTVSLYELFDDFSKYCDKEGVIINSIWNMYELRNQSFWNHLVTFDGMKNISLNTLEEQMKQYKEGDRSYKHYGRIRITSGGRAYLEYVVIHYEYFAMRLNTTLNKSLFLYNKQEISNINNVERVLDGVFQEVVKCIKKVSLFYKVVFEGKNQFTHEDFLGSKFAWHKIQENTNIVNSMFHGERIMHSHIGYLNAFRKYAFHILDDEKEEKRKINILVLKYIKKYIKMFNGESRIALCSEMSNTLVRYYNRCIKKIYESDYYDFQTDINRETGKKLGEETP